MRIHFILGITTLLLINACKKEVSTEVENTEQITIQKAITNLSNSLNSEIIVVSHRGDWRNAPENSLQAIKNCIEMGVDMVEIDVRETKDGHLVLMHDKTIDRTTTGSGSVNEFTLDSLKTFYLKDGLGVATSHKIPTLKEALVLTKDKILVNLDKSYKVFDKCYEIIEETGTQSQVVIKGVKKLYEVKKEFGEYLNKVHFMPILHLPDQDAQQIVNEYFNSDIPPVAFEFTVKSDTIGFLEEFKNLRKRGASIWVNSLWPQHNGGHDDEKAQQDSSIYQWYIDNNINIIQTDRPKLLLSFLREKGLHR